VTKRSHVASLVRAAYCLEGSCSDETPSAEGKYVKNGCMALD